MSSCRFLFFLRLLLLFPLPAFSQPAKTKVVRTEGDWLERTPLHNNQIYDILQDSRGFMWFATTRGLIKYDGASFTIYEYNPSDNKSIGFITPLRLLEDRQGKIWVGAHNGISIFDPKLESFTNFKSILHSEGVCDFNYVLSFAIDKNGTIWLGTDSGLCNYNPTEKKFTCFSEFAVYISDLEIENDTILWIANRNQNLTRFNTNNRKYTKVQIFDENRKQIEDRVTKILVTGNGSCWIHTRQGFVFRQKSPSRQPGTYHFHRQQEMDGLNIFTMTASRNGDVWFTGKRGLYYFDSKREAFFDITFEGYSPEVNREYYCFREDNRSLFWVGYQNGVVKWNSDQEAPFLIYDDFPSLKQVESQGIETIRLEKLDSQRILVGRNDGLFIFDQKEKRITAAGASFPELSGYDTLQITHLFKDSRSGIWVSARNESLLRTLFIRLDLLTKKIAIIDQVGALTFAMAESSDQTYWMGTWGGLVHYDLKKGILNWYQADPKNPNSLSDNDILSLALEHDSLLWIGTRGGGLNCFHIKTEQFTRFQYDPLDAKSLSNNQVVDLHLDGEGSLWVATYGGGLCKMDKSRPGFERFLKDQGLSTLNIAAVEEDNRNQIWVGTSEGISVLDRQSGMFQSYDVNNGAPFLVSWMSSVQDSEGFLYFGGKHSFVRFHPQHLKSDTVAPKLVFSEFYLNNELVLPQQKDSPLEQSISYTNAITLQHDQNFIRLKFAALNFILPEKNQYAYRMEGLIEEWQFLRDQHEVVFTDLDAGEYVLFVKGANQEGVWNENAISLKITILPPWYRTWWAYSLWVAIISGSVYWLYRFQLQRRLAEAESVRLKEMDLAKTRLYTNITHEFRTPLTVILGMEEQLRKDPGNWLDEGLRLIRRNGTQLLQLVNQLLDLTKLESGHLPFRPVLGELIAYMHYLTESFHSYADSKDIRLHFRSDLPELYMDHDPDKLQNVLSNLLSNAIKFTPAGGDVFVDVRWTEYRENKAADMPPEILIQVTDTGSGIASEHLPHIFDRFYQVDDTATRGSEGTGIGLALVKEMVRLMNGSITAESEPGMGAKFFIRLPVTRTAAQSPGNPAEALYGTVLLERETAAKVPASDPVDRYTVLLVEDNADVISYLSSVLQSQYRIATARNGQEGIDKALELVPDMIVSDVMMPGMDGFELCRILKTDERTSHIPIILLTAKADQASKIEGLTHGADVYLSKPFDREELLVRLEKLIELRRRLQERYSGIDNFSKVVNSAPVNLEDRFLQKVVRIVEKQMGDEAFGMPYLCKALHMSRSNLFRKLKALTGQSVTGFIRNLRLKKAKVLLETTEKNVTEVSFEVGFNSPNYFSRVFQEAFGVAPSEVRKG